MKYKLLKDGDTTRLRKDQSWRLECCDCGLVHDFYFEIVDGDKINITIYRNERATGQKRRHNAKTIT